MDTKTQSRDVHFVGSVPLDSSESVFRAVAETLGSLVKRIPDGETGDRTGWVGFQVPLLQGHPSLELVKPADDGFLDEIGRAQRDDYVMPKFRLRDDAEPDLFSLPSLGYADAAIDSYATFTRLKRSGLIPPAVRFQVSLPTPLAPVGLFIDTDCWDRILPAYRAAMLVELNQIVSAIPEQDLAIQWDVAVELAVLESVVPTPFLDPMKEIVRQLVDLGDSVPDPIELGIHFCYGDVGHEHFVEPDDLRWPVRLASEINSHIRRRVDFVHMPVPRDRNDDAYFTPLQELVLPAECTVFLGLIHMTDGLDASLDRLRTAAKYLPAAGVATECGFGRRDPRTVDALLDLHRDVASAEI